MQLQKIVVAPPPPKLYPRSEIGTSFWMHLFVQKFLHGKPTNRILKDFGEDKQKWWFWLIDSRDALVYILDASRSKQVPKEFFAGSEGTPMTEKYSSYESLNSGIQKVWCLVHLRKDLLNAYNGTPSPKAWLMLIAELFIA